MIQAMPTAGSSDGRVAVPGGAGARLGVVLCGGDSRRMGRDKAELVLGDRTLLRRAVDTLLAVAPGAVLACGSRPRYRALGLELALDRRPGGGPLAGLEAGLAAAEEAGARLVPTVACDMPGADAALFEALLARAEARGLDACLFATERGPEPLLAVYRTSCLPAVRAALDAGERKMTAFHRGFGALRIEAVEASELNLDETEGDRARNVNTPDDWEAERGPR